MDTKPKPAQSPVLLRGIPKSITTILCVFYAFMNPLFLPFLLDIPIVLVLNIAIFFTFKALRIYFPKLKALIPWLGMTVILSMLIMILDTQDHIITKVTTPIWSLFY